MRPDSGALVRRHTPLLIAAVIGAILFAALIFVLLTTRYKETEQARGVLQSDGPTQKITAPEAGRIVRWHVNEGDRVAVGQSLVTISRSRYDEDGNELSELMANELEQKKLLVEREIELVQQQAEVDQNRLQQALDENESIFELAKQEFDVSNEQLEISERQLVALQTLMKNSSATSRVELDRQRVTILEMRRQQFGAERRVKQQSSRVSELRQQLDSRQLHNDLALFPLRKQLVELEQAIHQARRSDNFVLVAEQAGEISAIALAEGQPVRGNELIARIGNPASDIEAVIYVPSRVAGKLFTGQEILLSFDAFDFHRFGRYPAKITRISTASLDPREALLPAPVSGEPVFRLTAQMEQNSVSGPKTYTLTAGLSFTADFVLDELPLLYFILKPVLELRGQLG